ncbi:uncharacterized protein LOC131281113 [Anopheles ziemanni]|uniref:uncharacterized protein LOC131263000 n=1 Tax=Anopheles coustani TaxID=139045 RepID=UPI00265841C4|nr:uncharacterized protein LOC131263000 [Anopheles coustani]XP_058166348.1 uncharacterized protein LOC131281113 [Anopheles ziemanni]
MDNLKNLFGQVSAMTSMKSSTASPSVSSLSGGSGGNRSGSGGPCSAAASSGPMRGHKTADRDSYYYIMWRS